MSVVLHPGDCLETMRQMKARGETVQAVVTDPPYHLTNKGGDKGFMGKSWDGGDIAARPETWKLCYDLLPPGGHLVAFGGTRTWHRMAVAIEDAGFELRDTIMWIFGSGFPKSHDVSKGIDKAAGVEREVVGFHERDNLRAGKAGFRNLDGANLERGQIALTAPTTPEAAQWAGWGTALKPAVEPIILARRPLIGTVAANVLAHGTGALNVDACRVAYEATANAATNPLYRVQNNYKVDVGSDSSGNSFTIKPNGGEVTANALGRWPANVVHDGSEEVEAAFAERTSSTQNQPKGSDGIWSGKSNTPCGAQYGNTGSASRFFYSAKADAEDRAGSKHPTVKPLALMRWLVRMVCPPGGTVLDLFAGSGTTGIAALSENMNAVLCEIEPEYQADILRRVEATTREITRQPDLFAQPKPVQETLL